jgi:hypothetical protein
MRSATYRLVCRNQSSSRVRGGIPENVCPGVCCLQAGDSSDNEEGAEEAKNKVG